MTIDKITDHAEQAKARLPDQFSGAANLANFFNVTGARTQELENQLFNLLEQRSLLTATGVQLDGLGQILDLAREVGETDVYYRANLIGRTGELSKSGEIETLIASFAALTGAVSVWAGEYFPGGISLVSHVDADGEDPNVDALWVEQMNQVKAAGVELTLQIVQALSAFEFSEISEVDANNNGPIDADLGFGDETLTEGGGLSRVI